MGSNSGMLNLGLRMMGSNDGTSGWNAGAVQKALKDLMCPRNRPSQPHVIGRETEAQGHSVSNGSVGGGTQGFWILAWSNCGSESSGGLLSTVLAFSVC